MILFCIVPAARKRPDGLNIVMGTTSELGLGNCKLQ